MDLYKKLRSFGWLGAILLATTFGPSPALAQGDNSGSAGSSGVSFTPVAGFWQNPNEPGGRGVVIETNASGEMFGAVLVFDNTGRSEWYIFETTAAADGRQAGLLQKFVGGQHLDGEYRQGAFLDFQGVVYFRFDSPTAGEMTWPGGVMPITRYDVIAGGAQSGPAAGAPAGSWWWAEGENGRGYFLEAQGDNLYFAALMYNDLGQSTWYYARGSMTTPTFFQGTLNEPHGGQSMMSEQFQQPTQNFNEGQITVQFTSNNAAMLTLHNGRQVPITRYGF
ncbi:MAG: hypothetical protein FJX54_03655 [Alphaproteobacteria bacterium]|nr:hypothetical protein [Alphaproteobacteria bacterium]